MKPKRSAGAAGRRVFAPALIILGLLAFRPSPVAGGDTYPGTIDPSEIKPGMEGYGLSVFQGRELARFQVTVIGVLKNALPRQDLIIVRCSGQDLEKTMIVAGMSGSPVYLDGRLAGAVSYGWAFSQDPLAGVTPVKYMIQAANQPPLKVAAAGPAWPVPERSWAPREDGSSAPPMPMAGAAGNARMAPIATPVLASGFSPQGLKLLSDELAPYNLVPMAGGGLASDKLDPAAAQAMVPGSAIGAALVTGDLSLTAIGTLTWRDGDKVAAFGHPFLQAGRISMPLVSADILTVVSLQDVSFKLGSPGAVVGELSSDGQAAITGVLGQQPDTVPMTIRIRREGAGLDDTYHLGLARDPTLTPLLIRIGLMEVIRSAAPSIEPTTVRAHTRLKLARYGDVEYEDVYAIMRNNFTMGLMDPVLFFARNPFEEIHIEAADVDLEVTDRLKVAAIDKVWADTDEAEPGSTIEVGVSLRPYGGEPVEYKFPVSVPDDDVKQLSLKIIGGDNAPPDAAYPEDVAGMIKFMHAVYPSDSLVVVYQVPGMGVDVNGNRLHSLPPSVSSMLQPKNARDNDAAPETTVLAQKTPYVIVGAQRITIRVKTPGPGK